MLLPQHVAAQGDRYQQAQARLLEPQQQVFITPLVADLRILNQERQTFEYPVGDVDMSKITLGEITDLKVLALYNMTVAFDADVVVAPTFYVDLQKKNSKIVVRGYPAIYENWKVANKETDYKWIENIYGVDIRTVDHTQSLRIGVNNSAPKQENVVIIK